MQGHGLVPPGRPQPLPFFQHSQRSRAAFGLMRLPFPPLDLGEFFRRQFGVVPHIGSPNGKGAEAPDCYKLAICEILKRL